MKSFVFFSLSSLIALWLSGCATPKPQMTPLQIQAMQTEQFKASKRAVFNATVTVLQDLGYIINSANFDTGFVTAKSPTQEGGFNTDFFESANVSGRTSVTAFITQNNNGKVSLRLNFVQNTTVAPYNSYDSQAPTTHDAQPILNPQLYTNTFNRIKQAIFVQEGQSKPE